jgi:DNA-binding transcriptional LysR family regulator
VRLDRFTGMAVFVKVVEASSFAAAARHFGMSPAMVSKHVQTMEERLGIRLLNRTTRHVSATEVGQNYYERCLRILADLDEAERAAGDLQTAPRGRLRVTAPVSFGIRHLGPAIADYLAAYPDVIVDLNLDDSYVDLLENGIDLAVRAGQLADSSLIARKLFTVETFVCASPGYLSLNGTPATPRDLAVHDCLIYTHATPHNVWSFTGPDGSEHVVRVNGRFLANNGDALKTLALSGAGIVLAPDFILEDELRTGRLVPLLPEYTKTGIPVHAVYSHSRFLSAKTRTFIDFLGARFGRTPQAQNGHADRPPIVADSEEPAAPMAALRAAS